METKSKHDLDSVIRAIYKKGCKTDILNFTVDISKATNMGNGTWGKLDYLVKYWRFSITGWFDFRKQF